MNAALIIGFWLVIVGAACMAGAIAHYGVPLEGQYIGMPIFMVIGGLIFGLFGVSH